MSIIIFILGSIVGLFLNVCIYKILKRKFIFKVDLFVKLFNGLLYLILYKHFEFSLDFVFYCVVFSILLIISLVDFHIQMIPNILNSFIFITTIIYKILKYIQYDDIASTIFDSLLGLFISSGLFLIIAMVSRGGIGGGDIKLIGVLGCILGSKLSLLNIFLSFVFGSIISIFLIIFRVKGKKDAIAFGPFICIAFLVTVLRGNTILNWYFKTF